MLSLKGSMVEYNRDAADLAWKRTLEFLNNRLS